MSWPRLPPAIVNPFASDRRFSKYWLTTMRLGVNMRAFPIPVTEEVKVSCCVARAFCRIKLLPVTCFGGHMLTVKLVYQLSDVPDDLKWATNTHMTPFTLTFKA